MQYDVIKAKMDFSNEMAQLTSELGYEASYEDTRYWLNELLRSPLHYVFAAVSAANVCGWLVVEKRLFLESGFKAEITGLVVGASYRRYGIARALVRAAEKWAQEQGLAQIVVRSNSVREESHIFYSSVGYQHTKTSESYVKWLNDISR